MKKLSIIGNWKSYKTASETQDWFDQISSNKDSFSALVDKDIILCVPFTVLAKAKSLLNQYMLPLYIGAQDISQFDEGKYTGAINGKQIQEFATYVIIGHSERRKYFGDTDEVVAEKIGKAVSYNLTPIVCISDIEQVHHIPDIGEDKQMVIAYEPLFAIGSGTPDTPENAELMCSRIQQLKPNVSVIYGGSVTSENVHSFTSMPSITGVLPGGASLDPQEFFQIIQNA